MGRRGLLLLALVGLLVLPWASAAPSASTGAVVEPFTHGGDPIPPPESIGVLTATQRAPACVEPGPTGLGTVLAPRAEVVYARAHDDTDRYAEKAPVLRGLTASANALVHRAAVETGVPADLKVLCQADEIVVHEAVLPTDMGDATAETIRDDLMDQGYDLSHAKYWVYYDDREACTCGGIAWLFEDDRPGPTNLHNGYAPLHAITFGYDSVRIWLHELGHTMGAVQRSAPHTTGAFHCTDGLDIMCYDDGGPQGDEYTTGVCDVQVWDCGHDDYFHTNPEPGSYLSTHWNIGHAWNRFLTFDAGPG